MRTLHIQIEDKYLDTILILLNSLKDGVIKGLSVDNEFVIDKDHCISDLKKIKLGGTQDFNQTTPSKLFKELELKDRHSKLTGATHRSSSYLAGQTIHDFIELHEWQIEELQEAIKEADAGEFASTKEIEDVFDKWAVNAN